MEKHGSSVSGREIGLIQTSLTDVLERTRIVGLCTRLTGDPDAAEDLAQETLLRALRHSHELRDPSKRSQWLSGIARNVCLMWARRRGLAVSDSVSPAA